MKRNRGAQPGNINALKHGLYRRKGQKKSENRLFLREDAVKDLDTKIAILRIKIGRILERDPDNIELICQALSRLAGLVLKKHRSQQSKRLKLVVEKLLPVPDLVAGEKD